MYQSSATSAVKMLYRKWYYVASANRSTKLGKPAASINNPRSLIFS
jgi:hypothetical protein